MTKRFTTSKMKALQRTRLRRRTLLLKRLIKRVMSEKYSMEQYLLLRQIGLQYARLKTELTRLGINIEDYIRDHSDVSRQWLDKHEELHRRWSEFLDAFAWAKCQRWEPDRKPSLKKALDMMEAKGRFDRFHLPALIGAAEAGGPSNPGPREGIPSQPASTPDGSRVEYLCGDALAVLRNLPSDSIDTCVTSPPYWGSLRDYGHPDQLGLEADPQVYIEKLVAIFRELRRVIVPGGTVWVVLGDTYT